MKGRWGTFKEQASKLGYNAKAEWREHVELPYRSHVEDSKLGTALRKTTHGARSTVGIIPKSLKAWGTSKEWTWHKLHNIYIPGFEANIPIPLTEKKQFTLGWSEIHADDILTSTPVIAAGTAAGVACSGLAIASAFSGWGTLATMPLALGAMTFTFGTAFCFEERQKIKNWERLQNNFIDQQHDIAKELEIALEPGKGKALNTPSLQYNMPETTRFDKLLQAARGTSMVSSNMSILAMSFFPPAIASAISLRGVVLGIDGIRAVRVASGLDPQKGEINKLSNEFSLLSELYFLTKDKDENPNQKPEGKRAMVSRKIKEGGHSLKNRLLDDDSHNPYAEAQDPRDKRIHAIQKKLEKMNPEHNLDFDNLTKEDIKQKIEETSDKICQEYAHLLQDAIAKDVMEHETDGMSERQKARMARRIEKNMHVLEKFDDNAKYQTPTEVAIKSIDRTLGVMEGSHQQHSRKYNDLNAALERLNTKNLAENITPPSFNHAQPLEEAQVNKTSVKKNLRDFSDTLHTLNHLPHKEQKTELRLAKSTLNAAREYYKGGQYTEAASVLQEGFNALEPVKQDIIDQSKTAVTKYYERSRYTNNQNAKSGDKKNTPHGEERYHYYKQAERMAKHLGDLGESSSVTEIAASQQTDTNDLSHLRKHRSYPKGIGIHNHKTTTNTPDEIAASQQKKGTNFLQRLHSETSARIHFR